MTSFTRSRTRPVAPLTFKVPDPRLMVQLRFGSELVERPVAVDQLGIEADQQRIFVTYRYPFRYVMHPRQLRSCTLSVRAA